MHRSAFHESHNLSVISRSAFLGTIEICIYRTRIGSGAPRRIGRCARLFYTTTRGGGGASRSLPSLFLPSPRAFRQCLFTAARRNGGSLLANFPRMEDLCGCLLKFWTKKKSHWNTFLSRISNTQLELFPECRKESYRRHKTPPQSGHCKRTPPVKNNLTISTFWINNINIILR